MNKFMRSDLQNYKPYHAPLKPYEIKIDANESPYPHEAAFNDHMTKWMEDKDQLTRYPDTDAHKLREKISDTYNLLGSKNRRLNKSGALMPVTLTKDNIICGVGSDQVIECIIKVFIDPGDIVLAPTPSFSMYKLSTILNHGHIIEYSLDENFNYNIDALIQLMKAKEPKLVFLCTPNNPTGGLLQESDILRVLDVANCPVVVDEAYAEFSGESMMDYINIYPNLILLRTFSKAFGLAGLRTGYAIACQEMIETIYVAKAPYNLSSYSQEASMFVLDHYDYYMNLVDQSNQERQALFNELKKLSFVERVYDSVTNFILIRVNKEGISSLCEENLILIRDYPPTGDLANCIRITVGTKEENKRLIKLLKEV